MLNLMVKSAEDELDTVSAAFADRTRRRVLQSLAEGDRPVSELAHAHQMSLPGFLKHLRVLEDAGLIARTKEGRVGSRELPAAPTEETPAWMARHVQFWAGTLDSRA